MAQARAKKFVRGKEIVLSIKKPGASVYTPIGCAEDITYKTDKETMKYSCRSGSGKMPSGEDPEWGLSIKGFYFIYSQAEQADNISMIEMHQWHYDDEVLDARWGSDKTGDPVFEGPIVFKSIQLESPNAGLATYSLECEGNEKVTVTQVA